METIVTKMSNENEPFDKMKKAMYRDELLLQMERNKSNLLIFHLVYNKFGINIVSKAEELRLKAAIDAYDERRL